MRPLAAVMLALCAPPVSAQRLPDVWTRSPALAARAQSGPPAAFRPNAGARLTGGVLGAAGGFFLGVYAGAELGRATSPSCDDDCGLLGAIVGGLLGESLGMVAGMAAADPNGTRSGDWIVAPAIALAGLGGALVTGQGAVLIAVPFAQLAVLMDPGDPR